MKNRITLLNGIRISLDMLKSYRGMHNTNIRTGDIERWYVCLYVGGEDEITQIFDTAEERDAFLSRLDNYFQEIA